MNHDLATQLLGEAILRAEKSQIELSELKARAAKRRELLANAGAQTFELKKSSQDSDLILCLCCGFSSPSKDDIYYRWCHFCDSFHTGPGPKSR